jgi:hypothetical protein
MKSSVKWGYDATTPIEIIYVSMNGREIMLNPNLQTLRGLSIAAAMFSIGGVSAPSFADDDSWKTAAIADASLAAPPSVTSDAKIYGWTKDGKLALAREGSGPYTCIASGAFSIRVGKPALPYPDPMCLDQNAWSFLQALWSKKEPLPTAPGLVWMLAGMNVTKSAVDIGASTISTTTGATDAKVVQMTPHVMILPLPFNKNVAHMKAKYNLEHPLDAWIMAASEPHEHLMVHFSDEDTKALMAPSH